MAKIEPGQIWKPRAGKARIVLRVTYEQRTTAKDTRIYWTTSERVARFVANGEPGGTGAWLDQFTAWMEAHGATCTETFAPLDKPKTFTLRTPDGDETRPIPYDASPEEIQDALDAARWPGEGSGPPTCENCEALATLYDPEGVPLCSECAHQLPRLSHGQTQARRKT